MSDTFKPYIKITADLGPLVSEHVTFQDSSGISFPCNHIEIVVEGGSNVAAIVEFSALGVSSQIGNSGADVGSGVSSITGSGIVGHGVQSFETTVITLPSTSKVDHLVIKTLVGTSRYIITYGNLTIRNKIRDSESNQGN